MMPHPESSLSCRRARVLLEAHLDGDLHGLRRAAMDTHLAGCHACSQELLRARRYQVPAAAALNRICSVGHH